ncbi:MAG: polyprenyl synthetase family protein [Bacteriovoracaceae bacterium]|nr:polyprenyl synthetase family protein [Bacteriovoracaceae bacterium]
MNIEFIKQIPPSILSRLKAIDLDVPSVHAHKAINELLQRSVLLGGKRLRPLLTYLFADFYDLPLEKVDICAKSIEMVHAASLAHDDVIDEATIRRGTPSINIQASNKKAVLAGDYLLAAVIGDLCRVGDLRLVEEMAQVIELLSAGEWLQSDLVLSRAYSEENLNEIALKKTASVMSWCAVSPALMKGLSKELVEYSRQFGQNLGVAFQLLDDTLDFSGDGRKDGLLDLKNGQINAVLFEWLKLHPEIKKKFHEGEDIVPLFNEEGLEKALSIVQERAKVHLNKCREILEILISELGGTVDPAILEKKSRPLQFILKYLENRRY